MIVAIHQPQYLPWLGYFDKIDKADIFVLLDDVQYKKNEWQNRNKIRTSSGWQWITVPVRYRFGRKINQVKIDNNRDWRRNHYKSLSMHYQKAPYFQDYVPFLKRAYAQDWGYLVDICSYFIGYLVSVLGITTRLVRSSQLRVTGNRSDRLVNICKELGADTYLSGQGAKTYLNLRQFKKEAIKVSFQDFVHPSYKQAYKEFEPFMSIIDLMFNCGAESLQVLKGGKE